MAIFLQDDFTVKISTLPYSGAVPFIDYNGEVSMSDYLMPVYICQNNKGKNIPIKVVDNQLVAEIVGLMYVPGDELDILLIIKANRANHNFFTEV